jgi:2-dehydro-3-deoxygluconokinase
MKKVITFGETMMRLTTLNNSRFSQASHYEVNFAGGESNVALSLAKLKIPAAHVTRLPEDELGDSVIEYYQRYGLDISHVKRGGKRLGKFFVEKGASIRAGKVIYDREDSSFATLDSSEFQWNEILKDAGWFHFTGITPAISSNAADACMNAVKEANKLGIEVSADVGYRSSLWKWGRKASEVMPDLINHCSIIVCSVHDAADVFGITPVSDHDPFVSIGKQLMDKYQQLKVIITTERGQLSASHNSLKGRCWNGTELLETDTIDIPNIVDRIGGGDAFIAGFIYGKIHYKEDLKALRFAVAASALKHTIDGDINLASVEEIESIMNGDTSGKLKR